MITINEEKTQEYINSNLHLRIFAISHISAHMAQELNQ